jgi:hypothetical protein
MKATLNDLMWSEMSVAYRAIADLKRSIKKLEAISPRTLRIETALKEAKDAEKQFCQAVKKPAFIEALIMTRIKEAKTRADNHSKIQSKRASKPRAVKGIDPETREKRNQEIKSAFEKKKNTANAFYIKHAKKHHLSPSAIRKIVKS